MGNSEEPNFDGFKEGEDIFNQFFGRRKDKSMEEEMEEDFGFGFKEKNGLPRHLDFEVDFKSTIYGDTFTFPMSLTLPCKSCNGKGIDEKFSGTCSKCKGHGKTVVTKGNRNYEKVCFICGGTGKVHIGCKPCNHSGFEVIEKNVKVKIPAGIKQGEILTMEGLGEPGLRGGKNGDLFIHVKIKSDPVYRNDPKEKFGIQSNLNINMFQAILGDTVSVKNPDGTVSSLKIPQGTQNNDTLKIPKKGIAFKGPHVVKINVLIPTELNSYQTKLLEDLKNSFNKN